MRCETDWELKCDHALCRFFGTWRLLLDAGTFHSASIHVCLSGRVLLQVVGLFFLIELELGSPTHDGGDYVLGG